MAMAWVFEHMEDPDFNDPPATSGATGENKGGDSFNEGDVATLSSFGYTTKQAQGALKATDHNMERYLLYIFIWPHHQEIYVDYFFYASLQSRRLAILTPGRLGFCGGTSVRREQW